MVRPFALCFALAPLIVVAQVMSDQEARDQMKYDVQYLASDLLEGRETGSAGERLAANYVMKKFQNVKVLPCGDSASYVQRFPFSLPPRAGEKCVLQVGRKVLKMNEQFFPMPMSGSGTVRTKLMKCGYGIRAHKLGYDDYDGIDVKGWAAAISIGSPDGIHPHSKYLDYHDLGKRIQDAIDLGANAVILYNNDETATPPSETLSTRIAAVTVPVLYIKGDAYKDLIATGNPVAIHVEIIREQRYGSNVVGRINNGRPNTVVIGAHMDHLGWGDEGSLHRGEPAIHNGADDNASGVAVMMQLARDLSAMEEARGSNYLFIAFSGEEKGLYGSNWWTKHPTMSLDSITYMINLDMVGRLDSMHRLAINGTGTSPTWDSLLTVLRKPVKTKDRKAAVDADTLHLVTKPDGIGPSDHTSFYLQNIPALHFFTGQHEDYHKPGDDEEKINYDGMLRVTRFIERMVVALNTSPKLVFTKTADADTASTPRFTVTLGVVPDYMYDGQGMRIDGVTDGKPAAKAGLLKGDVVIQLGEHRVNDMMSYMKSLSAFKKGDATRVKVLREGREIEADIQF
jgi:Zn-dependent M28 family amino/carboxypeptidase